MTCASVRCASMWSGPSWESSSMTKIAVDAQYGECDTASTSLPTAQSLSATIARGVGQLGLVPQVWSRGNLTNSTDGRSPLATYWSNSDFHTAKRSWSGIAMLKPANAVLVCASSVGSLYTVIGGTSVAHQP